MEGPIHCIAILICPTRKVACFASHKGSEVFIGKEISEPSIFHIYQVPFRSVTFELFLKLNPVVLLENYADELKETEETPNLGKSEGKLVRISVIDVYLLTG